ncbi:hypothetical protein Q3G72_008202 [Acer saccharum]|nr:hypothetical protein Q3G72_008202 [Acer saccharum]
MFLLLQSTPTTTPDLRSTPSVRRPLPFGDDSPLHPNMKRRTEETTSSLPVSTPNATLGYNQPPNITNVNQTFENVQAHTAEVLDAHTAEERLCVSRKMMVVGLWILGN